MDELYLEVASGEYGVNKSAVGNCYSLPSLLCLSLIKIGMAIVRRAYDDEIYNFFSNKTDSFIVHRFHK